MVLWEYKELATGANRHKTLSSAESGPNLQNKLQGRGRRAGRELQPLRQIELSRDRKFHKDLTEQVTFKQSL